MSKLTKLFVSAIRKSTQLPFYSHNNICGSLFYIIHSDVWMSPITYVNGFHYNVVFMDDLPVIYGFIL